MKIVSRRQFFETAAFAAAAVQAGAQPIAKLRLAGADYLRFMPLATGDLRPEAFELDEEGVAVFTRPETVEPERLLAACRACPVDALVVLDAHGRQVVP